MSAEGNKELTNIERVAQKGGLVNLLKAIGEDSPEILTTVMGGTISLTHGPLYGLAATTGVKLLHGALKGRAWQQIATEFKNLKDAGKINEDYLESDLGTACLTELLNAIDENPDPKRIEALRNVFLRIAMKPGEETTAAFQQQVLHIVGGLSSGEIILLSSMYRIPGRGSYTSAAQWLAEMAKASGMIEPSLVEINERPLIEKNLVIPREHSDRSGVRWGDINRLTGLGIKVCEYLRDYRATATG